jgi:hypothetical protein
LLPPKQPSTNTPPNQIGTIEFPIKNTSVFKSRNSHLKPETES